MDYRYHDKAVWESIFRDASESWLSAPASDLMFECASFLQAYGVKRALDVGSGYGRWANFVSQEAGCSVVGLDYALGGSRLGLKLAPASSDSRFVAGEITALPFPDGTFDGFMAVLILDNVAEPDGQIAARELSRVVRPGSPGFVVLNPWPMPPHAEAVDNPTRSCTRRDYSDDEALELLLSRWDVLQWRRVEHDLRAFQVRV
jgi:SAM-dependent methyltransferase